MIEPVIDSPEATPRFKLNKTITVGDIAVCVTVICGMFAAYSSLDKRVEKVEYAQTIQENRTKESLLDLKVDVKEIQGKISEVQRAIDRIPTPYSYRRNKD